MIYRYITSNFVEIVKDEVVKDHTACVYAQCFLCGKGRL